MGVWIETLSSSVISSETGVTPCVGVWIETTAQTGKLFVPKVTPCVGVWIETIDGLTEEWIKKSHPAWVCGLKQLPIDYFFDRDGHTLRGCVD